MAEQETLIYIDENDKREAGINAKHFTREDVRNRVYYNTLGAQLIKKFLVSENVDASNTCNIHSIKKILEEFDIADVMLGNIHIDVRVVFNENFIFIPKSHFQYEILPDIYLVLLMSNDKKYVKFLGFFEPKLINKNNQNEEYYFIEKEKLTPPVNLKNYIENSRGNTEQTLSDDEIDASDMMILSLIDHDIKDEDKKQLLKNLTKSAQLRDRFIEFENFETLSYRAEHSPEVQKSENPSFPSLEAAASATAEALQQFDFGGSARTEELPDENSIINGFNDLERNIPDLTPEENSNENAISPDDDIFQGLSELTINEDSLIENTAGSESLHVELDAGDNTQTLEFLASEPLETSMPEGKNDSKPENLNDIVLDFNELSGNDVSAHEGISDTEPSIIEDSDTAIRSGIIEQKHDSETVNFDDIMPLETEVHNSVTEDPAETIDFNDIEVLQEEGGSKTTAENNVPAETVNFDDIPLDSAHIESDKAAAELEITEELPELENFSNLASGDITGTAETNQANILKNTELQNQDSKESDEPEMLLDEPLQELSFDEENLILEEPLLEIPDETDDTAATEQAKETPAKTSDDTVVLDDFEKLILEDEKAHGIDNSKEITLQEEQPAQSELSPEDLELNGMLESENLFAKDETEEETSLQKPQITETPAEPATDDLMSGTDIAGADEMNAQQQENNLDDKTQVSEVRTEGLAPLAGTENEITDLNLNADEVEKSLVTDDIAGVEGLTEPQNTTELSTNELISEIDDLLGTGETQTETPENTAETEKVNYETDDSLGMLFNNSENAEDNSVMSGFDDEYDTKESNDFSTVNTPENGKKAMIATAAVVAVLAVAGSAGFFFLKNKNSSDLFAQNPIESETANLPANVPPAGTEDNTDLMTNAPDINTQAPKENVTPAKPAGTTNKPATPAKTQTQAKASSPAQASAGQKPAGTPLPYITVRSVAWEVPDYLSYSNKIKKYLQTAGKSIRLTLSSDLLLTNEYAYSNQIKVELKLKNDGTVQDAQITKSSGSNQINNIVLRTVKDTLKVVKPASGEIPTPDFKLGLIINL